MELKTQVFSTFRKAVVASLLVHIGIFIVINQYSFSPTPALHETSMEITFSRDEPSLIANNQKEVEPNEESVGETAVSSVLPPEGNDAKVTPTEESAAPTISEEVVLNEQIPPEGAVESTTLGISTEVLSSSIDSYLSNYSTELGRESVEACMRYKNRHGSRDCPQFAPALGQSTNGPKQTLLLIEDMDNLQALIDNDSIVDTIAQIKYSLDRDYSRDSSDGMATTFMASTTANATAGDAVLMLVGFDNDSISILAGLISFGFDGSIKFLGSEPELTLAPFTVTETATEFENYVEKPTASTFEVATPLFPAR